MVSFRFYLVSVTAIFLALAVGITVGATVIDKATVDLLHSQIQRAKTEVSSTNKRNDVLQGALDAANRFDSANAATFVHDRLTDDSIVMTAVHGNKADDGHVQELAQLLTAAGARVQGIVWFSDKLRLDKPGDATALSAALELPPTTPPDAVRRAALSRVAASWSGVSNVTNPLPALQSLQMIDFNPIAAKDITALTTAPTTRFVVTAPTDPVVTDDLLAIPLATELANRNTSDRVVAVEAGRDADASGKQPPIRAQFVGPLRSDGTLSSRVSTIDNLDDVRGQILAVYAVQNLSAGVVGHYGVGPGAADGLSLSAK